MATSRAPTSSILRPIRCANVDADSSADWAMTIELGACAWYSASHGGHVEPSSRTTTDSSVSSGCSITSLRVALRPRASVSLQNPGQFALPLRMGLFSARIRIRFEEIVSQRTKIGDASNFLDSSTQNAPRRGLGANDERLGERAGCPTRTSRV